MVGKSQDSSNSTPIIRQIWDLFSSIRSAIILIIIMVVLSLIGIFVADLFHSIWFLAAGALLIISIMVCSLNRWKRTVADISLSPLINSETFYKTGNDSSGLTYMPAGPAVAGLIAGILKKRRYSIRTESVSGNIYLAADKNRYSPLGTYLINLSLILFVAGFLVSSYFGFRDTEFIVPEEVTREIGYNTGLSLRLNSFSDEYWTDGSPKDYRSEIAIYRDNQEVKRGSVQVNHALSYGGVRIYQSFFGPAAQVQISNAKGKVLYKGNIALNMTLGENPNQRPSGGFRLIQEGLILYIVGRSTNIHDTILSEGQVGLEVYQINSATPLTSTKIDRGVPHQMENLVIIYLGDARFSGFQISSDPGSNLIWAASGLFLVGLLAVFYFPRRRIWAFIQNDAGKGSQFWVRTDSNRKLGSAAEIQSLLRALKSGVQRYG